MADSTPAAVKTPWHLWVVGVVSLLWNAVGALDFVMTQTKNAAYMKNFTPEQLEYFYGFPGWVIATLALGVWGSVFGSLLLLLRRRVAVEFFLASVAGILLTAVHNFVLTDGMKIMGGAGAAVFSGVICLIGVLLLFYSRAMRRRGVLG